MNADPSEDDLLTHARDDDESAATALLDRHREPLRQTIRLGLLSRNGWNRKENCNPSEGLPDVADP